MLPDIKTIGLPEIKRGESQRNVMPVDPSKDKMIPINMLTAYLLDRRQDLHILNLREKLRWVWQTLNSGELQQKMIINNLWKRPSLIKSYNAANKLKQIGNKEFAAKHLQHSLKTYNDALCLSKPSQLTCSKLGKSPRQVGGSNIL